MMKYVLLLAMAMLLSVSAAVADDSLGESKFSMQRFSHPRASPHDFAVNSLDSFHARPFRRPNSTRCQVLANEEDAEVGRDEREHLL
jgi:hypothetical protein